MVRTDIVSKHKSSMMDNRDRYNAFRRSSSIRSNAKKLRKGAKTKIKCNTKILQNLINAFGVSGSEGPVRSIIQKEIKNYCDSIKVDKMGNLIALKKGRGKNRGKIMLAAHMDEIGLMVKSVSDDGKVFVSAIGDFDIMSIVGQRVYVRTKKGRIYGAITTDDLADGLVVEKVPTIEDIYADTGYGGDELIKLGVKIGSYIEFEENAECKINEDFVFGKALDDRIGCYILIELIKKVNKTPNDIYFVFTVQEEIGLYGSKTSAFGIDPDWAVAVDITDSNENSANPTKIVGGGPTLTVKDAEMLGNRCMDEWLEEIADKKNIPIQLDVSDFGTTDAISIALSKDGVPVTALGVPIRGVHTTFSLASLMDIEDSIRLLVDLLKNPPKICLT